MALRNAERGEYHELLVVSSVATVVTVRIGLQISGYPRIAGGSLHIAHLLWGGLLMLASALVLLTYLNRSMMRLGAVLAGVGFGLFIDEVGKFVTADNDYFFRPALSLIYICFALLFLFTRSMRRTRELNDAEAKANAVLEDSDGTRNRYVAAKHRAAALLDKRWLSTGVMLSSSSNVVGAAVPVLPAANFRTSWSGVQPRGARSSSAGAASAFWAQRPNRCGQDRRGTGSSDGLARPRDAGRSRIEADTLG